VERLPKTEGKKAILFCTCALWKGRTFGVLKKILSDKGYEIILSLSQKMKQDQPADFSDPETKYRKHSKNSRNSHSGSTFVSAFNKGAIVSEITRKNEQHQAFSHGNFKSKFILHLLQSKQAMKVPS
jgi:hypothetical protein